jgi:hypothetical protein
MAEEVKILNSSYLLTRRSSLSRKKSVAAGEIHSLIEKKMFAQDF